MSALAIPLSPTATPNHARLDRVNSNSMVLLSLATVYVPERLLSNFNSPDTSPASAEDGLGAVDDGLVADGDGLDPDGDGLDPDGEGLDPDGEGLDPDGVGLAATFVITSVCLEIVSALPLAVATDIVTDEVVSDGAVQVTSVGVDDHTWREPEQLVPTLPAET